MNMKKRLSFCPFSYALGLVAILTIVLTIIVVMNDLNFFYDKTKYFIYVGIIAAYTGVFLDKRYKKKHDIKPFLYDINKLKHLKNVIIHYGIIFGILAILGLIYEFFFR